MKYFECQNCRTAVYFDSTVCVHCGHRLGYIPERFEMSALTPEGDRWRSLAAPDQAYSFCANSQYDACNWLIPADNGALVCTACRHNRTVPDLSVPENLANWRKIELAKRYLFYSLMRWRLPMPTRGESPELGLVFEFLSDVAKDDGSVERVLTGHNTGLITLSIAEADDAERERRRTSMHEPYRTVLGHFRHEIGHYYWDRLVHDRGMLERCRQLFGDETQDYEEALKRHYDSGAPADWQSAFISSYATAHPWEDFAETWAHYIHMVDGLETALAFGVDVRARRRNADSQDVNGTFEPYTAASAQVLVDAWIPLTIAINSVNRSMGQPDLYPFVLSPPVVDKLRFVHEIIHAETAST
ncbi:MAG: zinc-binding metallopeptidase family protein [Rhodoplanes sp.]